MKKNLVYEILLGVLALIVVGGFIAEITLAIGFSAPWYVIFWSILTPIIALYFIGRKLSALIQKDKEEKSRAVNADQTSEKTETSSEKTDESDKENSAEKDNNDADKNDNNGEKDKNE